MGGAFGHIDHPFERHDMTTGEIYTMLQHVADGKVDLFEKFDGINIMFRWFEGEWRFARSVTELRSGGIKLRDLESRFPAAPLVGTTLFNAFCAFEDLALSWYDTGRPDDPHWFSADVLSRSHRNVVQYDRDAIVIHPVGIAEKHVWDIKPYEMMYESSLNGWTVIGPQLVTPRHDVDPMKCLPLNWGKGSLRLTLGDGFAHLIAQDFKSKHMFDSKTATMVAERIVGVRGHKTLTEIKKGFIKSDAAVISAYVNAGVEHLRLARHQVESSIHDFSSELLRGVTSSLILEPEQEFKRMRQAYFNQLNVLTASGEKRMNADVGAVGEFEKITSPVEGVVFEWQGQLFKLVGYFKHVNQVMGFRRFTRQL